MTLQGYYLERRNYLSPENMEVVGRCGHIDNLPVYLLSLPAYISMHFGYDKWVVITHLISQGTCIFLVSTCVLHDNMNLINFYLLNMEQNSRALMHRFQKSRMWLAFY